jgi:hypothetical protein
MDLTAIPWDSSAIVLWLPEGEIPRVDALFDSQAQSAPPLPNPQAWWTFQEAIARLKSNHDHQGKVPWIKVGSTILSPDDIYDAYEFCRHHGTRK